MKNNHDDNNWHYVFINASNKIAKALLSTHRVAGYILHAPGAGTTDALVTILPEDALCIAPKVLHEKILQVRPKANVMTSHKYIKSPAYEGPIVFLYGVHPTGAIPGTVILRPKKGG